MELHVEIGELDGEATVPLIEETAFVDLVVGDVRVGESLPLDNGNLTAEPEPFADDDAEQQHQEGGVEQDRSQLADVALLPGDRPVRTDHAEPSSSQRPFGLLKRPLREERARASRGIAGAR